MNARLNPFYVVQGVTIPAGSHRVAGMLAVPPGATGIVVLAHDGGGGRMRRRDRSVAEVLHQAGLATLRLDLPGHDEAGGGREVGGARPLSERFLAAGDWLTRERATRALRMGYFAAGTAAAAALVAAARKPEAVLAVVSRDGRPDLAWDALPAVESPTLWIVDGRDEGIVALNRQARSLMGCPSQLVVISGTGRNSPGPGAPEEAARLASRWFEIYLTPAADPIEAAGLPLT